MIDLVVFTDISSRMIDEDVPTHNRYPPPLEASPHPIVSAQTPLHLLALDVSCPASYQPPVINLLKDELLLQNRLRPCCLKNEHYNWY